MWLVKCNISGGLVLLQIEDVDQTCWAEEELIKDGTK